MEPKTIDYRTWVYHEDCPGGKIIELKSKELLPAWLENNEGWIQDPHGLGAKVSDIKEESADNDPANKPPEEEKELTIPREIKDKIELLLSGEKVQKKKGLSLTSFCVINGIGTNSGEGTEREKITPLYQEILKAYQDKDRIEMIRSVWYFKGVKTGISQLGDAK